MTWSEILSESEASSTFKATFLDTVARYDQKKAKDYSDQCYHWHDRCGYRVERNFILLPSRDFKKLYGEDPSKFGIGEDTLTDDRGQQVTGILCLDHQQPYLRVVRWHEESGS